MKFYKTVAAICSLSLLFLAEGCANKSEKDAGKAKYIFLFIGDGMSSGSIALTESYLSYKSGKFGGELLTMSTFPYYGTATSHTADNYITDSSAAGTAIACGSKTKVSYLGVDEDGCPVKSMAYELKDEGYQIGIITNVPINHATPSAFYAHSDNRYAYYGISKEIAESGFDFLAGSGFIDFRGKTGEEEPIDNYLNSHGYKVCYGTGEFSSKGKDSEKVIYCHEHNRGKNAEDYIAGTSTNDATLSEMLQLGLDFLDKDKPFFIMCEGGTIDWCAHANKVMPTVIDILEMDKAVEFAYEFYKSNPEETLIIVTADHGTGGPALGMEPYNVYWGIIEEQWERDGHKNELNREENKNLNDRASIGWTTEAHTGEHVPVFAIGKGAEKFSGRMDNTEIKSKILCE